MYYEFVAMGWVPDADDADKRCGKSVCEKFNVESPTHAERLMRQKHPTIRDFRLVCKALDFDQLCGAAALAR